MHSEFSENAFFAALNLILDSNSEDNELIVFSAAKRSQLSSYGGWGLSGALAGVNTASLIAQENDRALALARAICASYLKRAAEAGVKAKGLCGLTDNIGELICSVAESRGCAFIILGRSGAGRAKRFLLGSVSQYVTSHAQSHVILVKGTPSPPEIHNDMTLEEIKAMEEAERAARIEDEHEREKMEERAAFLQSSLDAHIASMAEEGERQRRIAEDGPAEIHDDKAAILAAEEQERAERIAADKALDDAQASASRASLAYIQSAEQKERARRLAQDPPVSALSAVVNDYILEVESLELGFKEE